MQAGKMLPIPDLGFVRAAQLEESKTELYCRPGRRTDGDSFPAPESEDLKLSMPGAWANGISYHPWAWQIVKFSAPRWRRDHALHCGFDLFLQ